MSFSFTTRGVDKAETKAAVAAELDKVVEAQPIHENDRGAVQAAADGLIDVLRNDDNKDIAVTVSGSVSNWQAEDGGIVQASVNVSVSFADRAPVPVDAAEEQA